MSRLLILTLAMTCMAVQHAARAEIAPRTQEQLQSRASHILTGTVQAIFTREQTRGGWRDTTGVVEIAVEAVEQGERVEPGDLVYARFWRLAWIRPGLPERPYGSGHCLPDEGDRVRVYLESKNGGFETVLPNGFEQIAEPGEPAGP